MDAQGFHSYYFQQCGSSTQARTDTIERIFPAMKVFHCDHCAHLLFFENTECVSCHHRVAYLPDLRLVGSLDEEGTDHWRSPLARAAEAGYRLCQNYTNESVCNWAVAATDDSPLCVSCRLTSVIPNLANPANRAAWYRLEVAKRRLLFTLIELGVPIPNRVDDPERGLTFEFLADEDRDTPVMTGHADGLITVNIAEADDAERERRRTAMHEPYRTLLGHMRHESGHYYWDRLIAPTSEIDEFRSIFGDERRDYAEALSAYYDRGGPAEWQERFVSAYASSHPWEDWAETWAQYLHMIDTLETAAASGLSLTPRRRDEPTARAIPQPVSPRPPTFTVLIDSWFPLTFVLNNLNRGLGHPDAYPFVLSPSVVAKLKFVDDVVGRAKVSRKKESAAR
jgi:hypothetical protein